MGIERLFNFKALEEICKLVSVQMKKERVTRITGEFQHPDIRGMNMFHKTSTKTDPLGVEHTLLANESPPHVLLHTVFISSMLEACNWPCLEYLYHERQHTQN